MGRHETCLATRCGAGDDARDSGGEGAGVAVATAVQDTRRRHARCSNVAALRCTRLTRAGPSKEPPLVKKPLYHGED